jgi:hypothetical protein
MIEKRKYSKHKAYYIYDKRLQLVRVCATATTAGEFIFDRISRKPNCIYTETNSFNLFDGEFYIFDTLQFKTEYITPFNIGAMLSASNQFKKQ